MSDQLKDEEEVLKRDRPEGSKREPTVNENKPETSEPQPGPVSIQKLSENITYDVETLEGFNGGGDLG